MALFRLTALAFFSVAILLSHGAYTADNVKFIPKNDFENISTRSIAASYGYSEIAAVDLNRDGIDEFILKDNTKDKPPLFRVIAKKGDTDIEIGAVTARKIMISYEGHHGVRSILAFTNPHNDFDYEVYQWDAQQEHYALGQRITEEEEKT